MDLLKNRPEQIRDSVRDWGLQDTLERIVCKVAMRLLGRGLRKAEVPSLQALCAAAQVVFNDPDKLLSVYLSVGPSEIAALRQEYDELTVEIYRRYEDRYLTYPRSWAVGEGSAFLLYAIIRTTCPATVLETGVANGHSSFYILNALRRNSSSGVLHSVDISSNVGILIDPGEKTRWDLHLLSNSAPKKQFLEVLRSLPALDVMLHDSDHTYRWMRFELEAALGKMSASGLVFSDDADLSFALLDFCERHALKPILLIDAPKVLGVLPLGSRS
jgi:hypothetical protein